METSASVKSSNAVSPFVSKTLVRFFFFFPFISFLVSLNFVGFGENFGFFGVFGDFTEDSVLVAIKLQ